MDVVRNDGYCTESCEGMGVLHDYHGVGQAPVSQADIDRLKEKIAEHHRDIISKIEGESK